MKNIRLIRLCSMSYERECRNVGFCEKITTTLLRRPAKKHTHGTNPNHCTPKMAKCKRNTCIAQDHTALPIFETCSELGVQALATTPQ